MAVFKRKDREGWSIDYYYQGRRYRQTIGGRRADAVEALARIKVQIAADDFVPPEERKRQKSLEKQSVLFRDFAVNEYLNWSEINHSPNHRRLQESIIRVQLVPYFGERYLHEFTTKHIEDYVAQRRRGTYKKGRQRRPVKPGTVNRDLACLKLLFRKAVEWRHLDTSPTDRVKMLKEIPNPPRLLERDEVANLLLEMPDHQKALVATVAYAGLRREELFHLQWKDIDWPSDVEEVGQVNVVSRQDHPTKNNESRRIPMNKALEEALRRHPRRLGSPYVFANANGEPYDNIRKSLSSATQRAGIDGGVGLHQLRHAFCSHALMSGSDPRTVQRWMGHKDLKTTLKYAHVSPDHEKAAIQRLQYNSSHHTVTKITGT